MTDQPKEMKHKAVIHYFASGQYTRQWKYELGPEQELRFTDAWLYVTGSDGDRIDFAVPTSQVLCVEAGR